MKTQEKKLIEYNGMQLVWPFGDKKLLQVIDQVTDIAEIMKFVSDQSICVQAGGACGVWPIGFAQFFDTVYTFEPNPNNYMCLRENILEQNNIKAHNMALSSIHMDPVTINFHPSERDNFGAGYVRRANTESSIYSTKIDSLNLPSCGLIQLDIEGLEYEALKGAAKTIIEFLPVVVIEEKGLPQDGGIVDYRAREYLESCCYSEVGRIHKDIIFMAKR